MDALRQLESDVRREVVEAARESFLAYVLYTTPDYLATPFHRTVCEALEAVTRGDIRQLMITAPVRHGKTQTVSERWPLWHMGHHPGCHVLHAGYGTDIASKSGRALRNLTRNRYHRDVFPALVLGGENQAAHSWTTETGCEYYAAGTGAGIGGRGAHLGILDDAVRGWEAAFSPIQQEAAWNWYQSEYKARRMRDYRQVCIGTRWGELDIMGRILEEEGDQWEHLVFPAIDEDGNALAPDVIPLEQLIETRETTPPRIWQAVYQGDPMPDEGSFFQAEWLREGETTPPRGSLNVYGASDFAVSETGDFTVHVVIGIDETGHYWVLDCWRKKATAEVSVAAMLDMVKRWRPLAWGQEAGQLWRALKPLVSRLARERKAFVGYAPYPSSRDKMTRALGIQGVMEMGRMTFPKTAPWWPACKSELLRFPAGRHDDFVDALSLFGRMVDGMTAAVPKPKPKPAPPIVGMEALSLNDLWDFDRIGPAGMQERYRQRQRGAVALN